MVVERGDATGAWSFLNISVLQSIPLRCTVCHLDESDNSHLWIPSKMAQKHKKMVLTQKQKLKLIEKVQRQN
jgi:hypothetical protein